MATQFPQGRIFLLNLEFEHEAPRKLNVYGLQETSSMAFTEYISYCNFPSSANKMDLLPSTLKARQESK